MSAESWCPDGTRSCLTLLPSVDVVFLSGVWRRPVLAQRLTPSCVLEVVKFGYFISQYEFNEHDGVHSVSIDGDVSFVESVELRTEQIAPV